MDADLALLAEDSAPDARADFLRREGIADVAGWSRSASDGPGVMAMDGSRVVGAGRLYQSWLHPARWRLAIHVEPGRRRQGIGTALLDALIDGLPMDGRMIQAATSASNVAGTAFLRAQGFGPLMTTRLGSLEPSAVSTSWRERARQDREESARLGVRMVTLAEEPELFDDIAMLHERIYREQHAWNAPIDLTLAQARQLFMDDDELDPSMQLIAIRDGSGFGVASLRVTSDPGLLDLGWAGIVDDGRERSTPLLRALIGACVDNAASRVASIAIETDHADHATRAILDELPIAWGDDWLTFARSR